MSVPQLRGHGRHGDSGDEVHRQIRFSLTRFIPLGVSYFASGSSLLLASAAQLVTFAVLARSLGVDQFGLFAAISAVTTVAVNLCGLGAIECLVRRVARDNRIYPAMLGHNLILTGTTGVVLVGAGMVVLPLIYRISPDPAVNLAAIALLLVTNIVLVRLILLVEQIFIAFSNFSAANQAVVSFAVARTIAAVIACLLFHVSTVADWAVWQFACHLLLVLVYAWWLRPLGLPEFRLVREELSLGFLFSVPLILKALRQNVDLVVLSLVANSEIVGSYSVARRILDSSGLSIDALNRLVYPGSAQTTEHGLHHAVERVKKLLLAALGLGVATALFVYLVAPYLPYLFGHDYVSMVSFVRIVSWAVILFAIWSIAIQIIGAAGRHGVRASILGISSVVGSAISAWATWYAPPTGTFVSFYAVEAATAIAAWVVLLRLMRDPGDVALASGEVT
jgi:O-antigen/teichoic acid export membrane protein